MTDNGNFYRSNCIGVSLIAVLNELIQKKEISAEEATTILKSYDEEFAKELRSHMVIKKDLIFHDGEGKLSNYNNADTLWRMDLKDFKLKIGKEIVNYDTARLLFENNQNVTKTK